MRRAQRLQPRFERADRLFWRVRPAEALVRQALDDRERVLHAVVQLADQHLLVALASGSGGGGAMERQSRSIELCKTGCLGAIVNPAGVESVRKARESIGQPAAQDQSQHTTAKEDDEGQEGPSK